MSECSERVTVEQSPGHAISLCRGMRFASREDATRLVKDFALAQGKQAILNLKLTGGAMNVYACSSKTPCTFEVRVLKSKSSGSKDFFLSSFYADHNGCTGFPKATAKQVARMRAVVTQNNPKVSAKTLVNQVHMMEGVQVSTRMGYRVRDAIAEENNGKYQRSCQRLESLLQVFQRANPTAHMAYEGDADRRFRRAFLSHPAAAAMQTGAQNILGFDGAVMKTPQYQHQMLILLGRNGNNEVVVLAVCLCPSDDEANCLWFFQNCETAGISLQGIPLFVDWEKGGKAAGTQLGLDLRFCTRHIIESLKNEFKSALSGLLEERIRELQRAESALEFESLLKAIGDTNSDLEAAIRKIPTQQWAAYAGKSVKLYGWKTTNFVESEDAKELPDRDQSPAEFFLSYMKMFMASKHSRWVAGEGWINAGKKVTPYASKLHTEQANQARFHDVSLSGPTIAFVRDIRGSPPTSRRVDIDNKSCTCLFTRQHGVPCRHMLSALNTMAKSELVFEFFDSYYHVDAYIKANDVSGGSHIELPLDEDIVFDESVLAPLPTIERGPHKRRRVRSRRETDDCSSSKSRLCGKCRLPGHNARTCEQL